MPLLHSLIKALSLVCISVLHHVDIKCRWIS